MIDSLEKRLANLALGIHQIQESLPSVLVGHVVTPSGASKSSQAAAAVFDTLGLGLSPIDENATKYELPSECGEEWNCTFRWQNDALEGQAYGPICDFLRGLGLTGVDVRSGSTLFMDTSSAATFILAD